MTKPSDFRPPFRVADYVAPPSDPTDERIEVGVLVVGAGPAGLACAIRLGQLLEGAPEIKERLGDVPVAVLEKGKQAGSHLLSGASSGAESASTRCPSMGRSSTSPSTS
jgi:electron-transferring-flavoprotein dehydrogenase